MKGYTLYYSEISKQAAADEAMVESFVPSKHLVVQEAVYNFATIYEVVREYH